MAATSALRLLPALYLYGCPSNFLRIPPDPPLCFLLLGWVAAQAGVLAAQHAWGPRCILPPALRPVRYDYHRALLRPRGGHGGHAAATATAAVGAQPTPHAGAGAGASRWTSWLPFFFSSTSASVEPPPMPPGSLSPLPRSDDLPATLGRPVAPAPASAGEHAILQLIKANKQT